MFRKTLYAQIRENHFTVRVIGNSENFQEYADPPFSHPRTLLGNFTNAEHCFKALVKKARGTGLVFAMDIVMHPLEKIDGGLTQIEEQAFHEIAFSAGAKKAVVWTGHALSDDEAVGKIRASS